jgi:ferredoxin
MYDNLTIFYFTGTGNALTVANWIADEAIDRNLFVRIIKITPTLKVKADEFTENSLIGFCFPTHGFNTPPVVVNFCLRFPRLKSKAFLLNTRAGMKLNKFFTPGISGLAQLLPAFILRLKGLRTVAYQPMDLPSNWISVHPGLKEKVVDSIFTRCKQKTKEFSAKLLSGKRIYKGLLTLPIDILISPISVGYYFIGRFALAKTFVAGLNCNNCGLCIKECPVKAISLKNNSPFWSRKCESCMHCMNNCPKRAIHTPHLFVVIVWWLAFSIIPFYVTLTLGRRIPFIDSHFELFVDVFLILTGFPVIFFSYRTFHFLMRYRFFNWLMTYTSLTKFKFWRRYMAPQKYLHSR